MRAKMIG